MAIEIVKRKEVRGMRIRRVDLFSVILSFFCNRKGPSVHYIL